MSRYDDYRDESDSWRLKGARFLRYLSTRKMECWGFSPPVLSSQPFFKPTLGDVSWEFFLAWVTSSTPTSTP